MFLACVVLTRTALCQVCGSLSLVLWRDDLLGKLSWKRLVGKRPCVITLISVSSTDTARGLHLPEISFRHGVVSIQLHKIQSNLSVPFFCLRWLIASWISSVFSYVFFCFLGIDEFPPILAEFPFFVFPVDFVKANISRVLEAATPWIFCKPVACPASENTSPEGQTYSPLPWSVELENSPSYREPSSHVKRPGPCRSPRSIEPDIS